MIVAKQFDIVHACRMDGKLSALAILTFTVKFHFFVYITKVPLAVV